MSLAHRHIQLGRRIVGIACGILDHNALVPAVIRALFRTGKRHYFHAEIPPNAVLHMHHIIALLQLGEVDVERGFHYRAVATFHSARTLHLVPAKHLRIAHHHPAPGTVEESRLKVPSAISSLPPSASNPYSAHNSSSRCCSPALLQSTSTV